MALWRAQDSPKGLPGTAQALWFMGIVPNTLWGAMWALDVRPDQMTMHGFRAMARTILDEVLGFRLDFIEHQLAHAVRDPMNPQNCIYGTVSRGRGSGSPSLLSSRVPDKRS